MKCLKLLPAVAIIVMIVAFGAAPEPAKAAQPTSSTSVFPAENITIEVWWHEYGPFTAYVKELIEVDRLGHVAVGVQVVRPQHVFFGLRGGEHRHRDALQVVVVLHLGQHLPPVLAGQVQGRSLEDSLRMGAIAAAEVISHYGARPEAKLDDLIKTRLG